jgi:UDPglucose 6-dehydrogenase
LTYWESADGMIVDVSKYDKIVVEKSTILVKIAEAIEKRIKFCQILNSLLMELQFKTFFNPNRVVIGGRESPEGKKAIQTLKEI